MEPANHFGTRIIVFSFITGLIAAFSWGASNPSSKGLPCDASRMSGDRPNEIMLKDEAGRFRPALTAGLNSVPQATPVPQYKSMILKEELTIGSVSDDENSAFGSSLYFNVDNQGRIYVTDRDAKQIKIFGADGRFIKPLGRYGQGPGEYQILSGIRIMKDGILYLVDSMMSKTIFFDPDGNYLRQDSIPQGIILFGISPEKTYLGTKKLSVSESGGQNIHLGKIMIFDNEFRPIIELYQSSIGAGFGFDSTLSMAQNYARIYNGILSTSQPIVGMGEDGKIYVGSDKAYSIEVYSPNGKKIATMRRECSPLKYEQKDKDLFFSQIEVQGESEGFWEKLKKEIPSLVQFPKYKPYYIEFIPMDEGRLAVLVDSSGYDSSTLDVFDRDCRFQGRITVPISSKDLMFKNGKAYCIQPDAEGYLFIKRYSYELK